MENEKTEYNVKPYEELDFSDDFMFGKVTQDQELSRDLLQCLLQREVGELQEITSQKEFRYTKDGKPIRMDMYSRDNSRVYDSEMMNQNNKTIESLQLPRRTRFYQSSIDTDHMNRGISYKKLPDSTIIFICTFDPFGKGLARYTFLPKCLEEDLLLNDGTERIFFNCTYNGDDIPEELRSFYNYMQTGKADSDLTKKISDAISEARKREEWKSEYMKEQVLLMDARDEGREEEKINTEIQQERADREAERADREAQRADRETQRADRETQRADRETQRADFVIKNTIEILREIGKSKKSTIQKLVEKFNLSPDEAEEKVNAVWD